MGALTPGSTAPRVAVVAIGRNEGDRLERCLDAILREGVPAVYLDSGSTDGSVGRARARGIPAVELDPGHPFTAARARNEGMDEALRLAPDTELVQFVDGDCELVRGWLARGTRALASDPRAAVACGRVRERDRDRSVYNLLCDLEWRALGGAGGNAMMRVRAFREVGGFDARLIAGEEADLSARLHRAGWRTVRLPDEMVLHDSAMLRFGQWWRRTLRSGWAFAEAAARCRFGERAVVRENLSIALFGAVLPTAAVLLAVPTSGASLSLLVGHLALGARIYLGARRSGLPRREALLQSAFTVLGKVPQAIGQAQFAILRAFGRGRRIVDWRVAR